jgi:hypothetical protein
MIFTLYRQKRVEERAGGEAWDTKKAIILR